MALQEELESQGNFLFKHRSNLPIIILLAAIGFFIINKITMKPNLTGSSDEYILLCFAVSMLGLFIRVYTVGYTPNRTSGRNTKEQVAEELNSSGIYSLVRHPLYIGNFFMWLGIGMLTGSFWFNFVFFLIYWIYYERIMFAEEQFLRRKFGEAYIKWAEHTPAVVPNFKNWQKPARSFSWKKIIKKEKNGFLAVLMLIVFFDFMSDVIRHGKFIYHYDVWFVMMLSGLVFYITIKIIRKNTKLLNE